MHTQTYLEKIAEQFEVDWQPTIKLTTDQMVEPMAAPVGYSVQPGQGTGLGTSAQAQWTTGTQNTDEEINYRKDDIPPPAPTGHTSPPTVNATPYNLTNGKSDNLPTAKTFVPGSAVSPSSTITNTQINGQGGKTDYNNNAYEEVDIYVPQIPPSAPPAEDKNNGDDEDDQKPPASGDDATSPSGGTSSYADLAARFEQLNK